MVQHCGHGGAEALELADPVGQGGEGSQDHEGPPHALLVQVGQEANCLDLHV